MACFEPSRNSIIAIIVKDPQTGESFETGGQSRYYYRIAGASPDAALGVDSDFNPAPELDMRRLLQVGVDLPDR